MSKRTSQEIELLSGQRQNGETDKAVQACNDWLRLGSGRSLPKLLEQYRQSSAFVSSFNPPSSSYKTLNTWSSRYDWPGRARQYDASWEARKNAEREAVLGYGLALDYERLRNLYRLAAFLEAQIYERGAEGVYHNVWLPDVKQIGSGDDAERVDIERFNSPLIEQYRKVLDDIAHEVGGRIQKADIKVEDWRSEVVALLREGKVTPEQVEAELGKSLAQELFNAVGIPVTTTRED
jgi:hypothetical protein